VELMRCIYRAMNARDTDALVDLCDPDVEVQSVFSAVGGATYQGHEGVRQWQANLQESWGGEFRVDTLAYFDLGERTVVFGVLHGRGGQSGVEVTMPATGVAEWRNGLCTFHKAYAEREEALAALGVLEDELEPLPP
jgi:ketosteroid isomerase-like protein